jgi:ribose transport system permease protein
MEQIKLGQNTKRLREGPTFKVISNNLIFVALILLCVILSILSDRFLTLTNFMNIIVQSTTTGLVTVGMTYVILTGGIDLSVGSVLAIASAIGASVIKTGSPIWLGILAMLLVGTLFGLFQGLLISKLKMPAFIVTLGGMTIARGLTMVFLQGKTIAGLSSRFQFIGNGFIAGAVPVPVILMIVVFLVAFYVLRFTSFGRGLYAIGGNREAAKLSGLNTDRIETTAFAFCGFAAGLGGVVLTARLGTAIPTAGNGLELDAIGAVVIGGASLAGGRGTIFGTLIGVLILGVLNNGLNLLNVDPFFKGVVQGAVILTAVFIDTLRKRREVA